MLRRRMRAILLVLAVSVAARAQNSPADPGAPWPTTVDFARATAMGGAHTAIATGNDAVVVNPAGLSQNPRYHFEIDGLLDSPFPAQGLMLSVVDTKSSPLGSGLFFSRWGAGQPGGRADGWLGGAAYSYPAGGSFFIGGATKYVRFHGPDGLTAHFAQDFGVLGRAGAFTWGASVQNLSTQKLPLFPPQGALGIALGSDADWHLAFDYKTDLSDLQNLKHRFALGGEMLLGDAFVVRAGGTYDPQQHFWWASAGVGILTEKGGLQVVWRRRVEGPYDQFWMGALTLYLE